MSVAAKLKRLFSERPSFCAYLLFGVTTFIVFTSLFIWSLLGGGVGETEILPAFLEREEGFRTDYLVGETFRTEGLKMNIGSQKKPKYVPLSDCVVSADFSSAGNKQAIVSYEESEYKKYVATLDVHVCFVRALTVRCVPSSIEVSDGKMTTSDDFLITATLGETPPEVFSPYGSGGNEIVLTEDIYSVNVRSDPAIEGYYESEISCGKLRANLNFYNAAGRTFIVGSQKDIVFYETREGEGNLSLVVTEKSETYYRSQGDTRGYYIYRNGEREEVVDFAYSLTATEEIFSSEGVAESVLQGGYEAIYAGERFFVGAALFQSSVVGGTVYTDGGYKIVTEGVSRVATVSSASGATLTLYVTKSSFATTGYGDAFGYYVFTDRYGVSYKFDFICHSFGWEYVPWPVDGERYEERSYEDISIDDYIVPGSTYSGPLTVEIENGGTWIRGEGTTGAYSEKFEIKDIGITR